MSIFSDISSVLNDMISLLLPRACIACGKLLLENEACLCLSCRYNMPLTGFSKNRNNPVRLLFENELSVEAATAMLWYVDGTDWQRLIHNFKYKGRWMFARKMGEWLGEELRESGNFDDVDLIIPVPLYFLRRLKRGYNQSEMLALGVSREMGVRCDFRSVRRRVYNESQTSKSHIERWDNVEGIFDVRKVENLRGRHILLIDDVLTTGATMCSLASTIKRACDGDVRISIASLAVSRRIVNDR